MRRSAFLAGCASATALSGFGSDAGAQSLDLVNIGTLRSVADTPFIIAEHKGYFREVGIRTNYVPFDSAAVMVAPLGTGQLDVAGGAPSAGLYNAVARGIGIKIVGDRGTDPPGYGFTALLVRKDLVESGRYKTYADLKGMRVAEPAKGASTFCEVLKAGERGGLRYDDMQHVLLSFPDQIIALRNRSIDATIALEPWGTIARNDGYAVRVAGCDAFWPHEQITVILYADKLIHDKPDLARRFMLAYVRACRYYRDALRDGHLAGRNAEEIIGWVSSDLHVETPILRAMYAQYIDPDVRVNMTMLNADYALFKQYGLLTGEVSVADVVDMSFAESAIKSLGPYRPGHA